MGLDEVADAIIGQHLGPLTPARPKSGLNLPPLLNLVCACQTPWRVFRHDPQQEAQAKSKAPASASFALPWLCYITFTLGIFRVI